MLLTNFLNDFEMVPVSAIIIIIIIIILRNCLYNFSGSQNTTYVLSEAVVK
jgi:hypothetical protein